MSWDMYDMTQKVQVVVVAIVLPLVILAASLWHDWVEEGQSPRARKIMKDWEWNIDEMAHAVNVKKPLDRLPCAAGRCYHLSWLQPPFP